MKKIILIFLILLVNILFFGILARILDLFIYNCEWKCTTWFFFGSICSLSIIYFIRNFTSKY